MSRRYIDRTTSSICGLCPLDDGSAVMRQIRVNAHETARCRHLIFTFGPSTHGLRLLFFLFIFDTPITTSLHIPTGFGLAYLHFTLSLWSGNWEIGKGDRKALVQHAGFLGGPGHYKRAMGGITEQRLTESEFLAFSCVTPRGSDLFQTV